MYTAEKLSTQSVKTKSVQFVATNNHKIAFEKAITKKARAYVIHAYIHITYCRFGLFCVTSLLLSFLLPHCFAKEE